MKDHLLLGIDLGTTNISAVIYDSDESRIFETFIEPTAPRLSSDRDLAEYDASQIIAQAKGLLDRAVASFPGIRAIGVTGQMHGIVYVSEEGKAISPLYNWQDGRGNRSYAPGVTYCDEIMNRTGHVCHTGYGAATLYYNHENRLEPEGAVSFGTVMDLLVMELTGRSKPLIHASNAASLGVYDMEKNRFDANAFGKLQLNHLALPEVTCGADFAGSYNGIPVCVAIGDNQASFYGSVRGEGCALVNFGTGSQISIVSERYVTPPENLEIRPYLFGKYLLCGSALCGGKAYALLEQFFRGYAAQFRTDPVSQYEMMNRLAEEAYANGCRLAVSTCFCGTRADPSLRGSIWGIDDRNFTPGNLILGVLQGMVDELKTYYDAMNISHITSLAASGNAVKKNVTLQKLLCDTFGMPLTLTDINEEAALGSALYAGAAAL